MRAIFRVLLGFKVIGVDFLLHGTDVDAGLKLSVEESSTLNRFTDVKELRSWEDPTV